MALRYLPMISGQQHHHHGNEKQQPVHLPVAVYSGQEQPQGPECKQTVTTHRYPNRYFPRDDLGNKQLDSDHNRQSPQQPLGSEDALGIGLIDTYGGLYAAIAIAADKAELGDDYRVTEVFDEPMDLPLLFQFFGAQLRSSFTRSELGDAMQTYERIQEAVSQQGVVMYCPYRMDLEVQ